MYSIWRSPQAFSSFIGSHRTRDVGMRRTGGGILPGLRNEPCRNCSPRSMTLVSAEEPQARQVFRWTRCMGRRKSIAQRRSGPSDRDAAHIPPRHAARHRPRPRQACLGQLLCARGRTRTRCGEGGLREGERAAVADREREGRVEAQPAEPEASVVAEEPPPPGDARHARFVHAAPRHRIRPRGHVVAR